MQNKTPILQMTNVSKSYSQGQQERRVLDQIQLEIYPGEIVAIIGSSGSGKSTLLNIMSGIDNPDAGEIKVDQQTINQLTEYQRTCFRRSHIGFIFQFFNLIPTLTAKENILLPLELNQSLIENRDKYINELLTTVNLSDRKDDFPEQLSGGEQQRIALLRAIAHKPKIVFADEPTGNLDTSTGKDVLKLLQDMVIKFNTTLIVVTHSQEVSNIADRVFSMQNGKMVAT